MFEWNEINEISMSGSFHGYMLHRTEIQSRRSSFYNIGTAAALLVLNWKPRVGRVLHEGRNNASVLTLPTISSQICFKL
jgi:hypothetical protein